MATIRLIICALFLLFTFSSEIVEGLLSIDESNLKTYIVHVEPPETRLLTDDLHNYHRSFVPIRLASSNASQRLFYSYSRVFSGFAARLTEEDVKAMRNKNGFVSAQPERTLYPMTTHSPQFLGLREEVGFLKDSNFGKGMIIGVVDSGIDPDHPSFSDVGMPPPPARWKGICEFVEGSSTGCNNKIIGARSLNVRTGKWESPKDTYGHGTLCASIAAGGFVKDASVLGRAAKGTAAGMAPYAHLSIYKACFGTTCQEANLLAAIEAAVEDGVDVISLSTGTKSNVPFFLDPVAIATYGAMLEGIFVSSAAGNDGPRKRTISNAAPWLLTVGASTIDRQILATAQIGDLHHEEYVGESLFQPENFSPAGFRPLVYAGSSGNKDSALCGAGALKGFDVKGKIVLCENAGVDGGQEVLNAGGAGMISMNIEQDGFSINAVAHVLPATRISYAAGVKIKAYITSTPKPVANILFKGTVIGDKSSAPQVAAMSSRGPSVLTPGILKPDILGPGVNILAASIAKTKGLFEIITGTSMACPHLSGIGALLKSAHPKWSPAAIKSAIMTSADLVTRNGTLIMDQNLVSADIFATGAGHINPSKANDPGLIYDILPDDYLQYLCGLSYSDRQVSSIVGTPTKCTSKITEGQLNYPSFSVKLGPTQEFTRRVTNVGEAYSTYVAVVVAPKGVIVTVKPKRLFFSEVKQVLSYSVTFTRSDPGATEPSRGHVAWVSTKHIVRSVIAVKFATTNAESHNLEMPKGSCGTCGMASSE